MVFLCLKCGLEDDEEICDNCLMKEVFNEYEYKYTSIKKTTTPLTPDNQIALELCESILEWDEKMLNFNTDFVESVKKWIVSGDDCSEKQYLALHNIVDKFHIKI